MQQIQEIQFTFSTTTREEALAFDQLNSIVGTPKASVRPMDLFPNVGLRKSDRAGVSLAIDGQESMVFPREPIVAEYALVPLSELARLFKTHVVHIDHLGINLPVENTVGHDLLDLVAQGAHLYEYPSGEPWFFVIPATPQEYQEGITNFLDVRLPKFEIVIEGGNRSPLMIQIDCATNLTREEIEDCLPRPYGIGYPGLDTYFRSVFVAHPWGGFLLRMDFRYHTTEVVNEWTTSEWLVKKGKRYTGLAV